MSQTYAYLSEYEKEASSNCLGNNFSNTPKNKKTYNTLSLFKFKSDVIKITQNIAKIRNIEEELRNRLNTIASEDFDRHVETIRNLQSEINKNINIFDDFETIKKLQSTLSKRSNKRMRLKNRKISTKIQQDRRRLVDSTKRKNIDEWLMKKNAEILEKQRIETVKLKADAVLRDVQKCRSDARKSINLLDSLQKLRIARERKASGCGECISSSESKSFMSSVEKLKLLWNNALLKYVEREAKLKTILENDNKTEQIEPQCTNDSENIIKKWKHIMFGCEDILPHKNYNNLYKFIAVRKQWDQYVCLPNEGSKIPVGWLMPPVPSMNWKIYLVSQQ